METNNFLISYNARHLAPKEVAERFIWSESFDKLVKNNHSIILGARGCGKTTLMKMLTIPALHAWNSDSKAEDIRNNIPFYGIYISTDIYWNVKNLTYGSQLEAYGTFADMVSHFAVSSNVFTSLCDSFLNIINIELKNKDEKKEIELCSHLIKAWKLSNTIPKLKYVKEALNDRIDSVNQFIQQVIFNYAPGDKIDVPDYYNLSFETSLELIIPKFERIYGIEEKKKWALCFDELEFAPIWLQQKLFISLRSRTQYLLYKLSASPILPSALEKSLLSDYGATPGNDVELIKMWISKDNEEFSKKIIKSFLPSNSNLVKVFGSNDIYNKTSDSYSEGSDFYKEMISLINKDESFKSFLENKDVDIANPIPINDNQKDVLYRKIKPIVYFRNFFIEENIVRKKVKYRSRKKATDLFSGIEVISKICDGNPRWLIGIVSAIISKSNGGNIDKKQQFDELLNVSKRYKNVIANIPVGDCNFTIIDIIERVGKYFENQILGENFLMDPKSTFLVDNSDDKIHDNIVELIEKGVAQGAFILLDSNDDSFDFEIRNKRFKLSYIFCILYNIPLRVYNKTKLSECLTLLDDAGQISLFN
ncbi:ORC-CDC6 family AAA ATPase [Mariniflexile maritimum]|uniref:ORC-CDC6 family AAA ATPase n=1 Tax=Mariniflexile maritimum TaxID=2682493 RepID=UPI0012F686B7|nr:hypothetical protein [Mariniflexile maritimum]